MTSDVSPVAEARRVLRGEQMKLYAGEIPWLHDPELIPESAISFGEASASPCHRLAEWMVDQFSQWSDSTNGRLDYGAVFEELGTPIRAQAPAREMIRFGTAHFFDPGLVAVAEIHETAPIIAGREAVPAAHWQLIAERASTFGLEIARRPTLVQAAARAYLGGAMSGQAFDPAKVKLDPKRGITPVESLPHLLDATQDAVARYVDLSNMPACLAAIVRPHGLDESLFMATWRAFSSAVGRYVYPNQEVDRGQVPPPGPPDEALEPTLDRIAQSLAEYYKFVASQKYTAGPGGIRRIE